VKQLKQVNSDKEDVSFQNTNAKRIRASDEIEILESNSTFTFKQPFDCNMAAQAFASCSGGGSGSSTQRQHRSASMSNTSLRSSSTNPTAAKSMPNQSSYAKMVTSRANAPQASANSSHARAAKQQGAHTAQRQQQISNNTSEWRTAGKRHQQSNRHTPRPKAPTSARPTPIQGTQAVTSESLLRAAVKRHHFLINGCSANTSLDDLNAHIKDLHVEILDLKEVFIGKFHKSFHLIVADCDSSKVKNPGSWPRNITIGRFHLNYSNSKNSLDNKAQSTTSTAKPQTSNVQNMDFTQNSNSQVS
jgi:hypothetical protein